FCEPRFRAGENPMSQCLSRWWVSALVLGSALSLGCPASVYHSETFLYADGSVERTIYQPTVETPEAARKAELWKKATYAPDPEALKKQKFVGKYADLPPADSGKDTPYFVGVGRFPSPKDIPDTYERRAPPNSGLA